VEFVFRRSATSQLRGEGLGELVGVQMEIDEGVFLRVDIPFHTRGSLGGLLRHDAGPSTTHLDAAMILLRDTVEMQGLGWNGTGQIPFFTPR